MRENENAILIEENNKLQNIITNLKLEIDANQSKGGNNELIIAENRKLMNDLENLRKEQEDLLVLLTDQDSKLRHFKQRLKDLGHPVRVAINY